MNPFGWAIIGPGKIAHRFAAAVQGIEAASLIAVQGRDADRAQEFAREWARHDAPISTTTNIDALLDNARVDGIYIATPHAFHASAIRLCIAAGKPVLCEKPLVANLAQGIDVVALAREKKVFLMEAVWTRFLPVYKVVQDWLGSRAIGQIRAIQSSFCFNAEYDAAHRNFDPAQAGGSLLDLGIYNLTMTRWALHAALGHCPPLQSLQAHAAIGPTGVDHRLCATLAFADGVASQFICGFDASADNSLRIIGELGTICVSTFWQGTDAELRIAGGDTLTVSRPFITNGFEAEIEEAMGLIRRGEIESPRMSHAETLETLTWMDRIRERIGVRYPFET